MTTTDDCLFLKNNKPPSFSHSDADNLNLNQNHKCPILILVQTCSKQNEICNGGIAAERKLADSKISDNNEEKLLSKNKSSLTFNNGNFYDKKQDIVENKRQSCRKREDFQNEGRASINNNSTLSLYIANYENSNKAITSYSSGIKKDECKKKPGIIVTSAFFIQNPFEFPRQQNYDKVTNPEVSQFKASQRLINPNETSNSNSAHKEPSKMESPHHLPLGTLIMHNGDRGYIRYYGEVNGYDGCWYGIEWENYTKRGKHNGTVKGKKYFESKNPKGASFIRETENITAGEDIISLIAQRYAESAVKYKAEVNKFDIELEEDQIEKRKYDEKLSKVYAITLDRYPLAFCKSLNEKIFPACKDLVISYTLLTKWSDIFEILKLFPNLRHLDISNNLLEKLSDLGDLENITIKNPLKELKVNQCNMDDESVYRLLLLFPDIVELHLTDNLLKSVSIPLNYSSLEIIYLQDNNLITFNNLRSLGCLPRLKYMNVSNCNISKITVSEPFAALEKLVAADNKFSHWDDIMEINKFPNLKQIVLQVRLPVPKGMDPREVMVVKFPNIIELDRLDISPVFRRNCEYDFMNKISSLNPIPSYFNVDIQRLQKIYPDFELELPESQSTTTKVLDKEMINLQFIYGDTKFEKVFDATQDFSQIIKTVCRKMKLPTRGIEVYIRRNQKDFNGYGDNEELITYLTSNVKSYDLDENSTVVLKISN